MPIKFGAPELMIIFAIIVLVFGVGRLGRIGGELGSAIKSFREGISSGKDETETTTDAKPAEKA